jgi:hypothetical protein
MGRSNLARPWSAELTLAETIDRLARNRRTRAVSHLGSTGTDVRTEHSDFDLCVLAARYGQGCGVEATIIDGRIADVVVLDVDRVESLVGPEAAIAAQVVSRAQWPFVHWLAQSRPVYDPDGFAAWAQERATHVVACEPGPDSAWQDTTRSFLTHDVRVNAALLARADDPLMRVALGMRQLHTFVSAVQGWFTSRGLRQAGWKRDMAQIARTDPDFLAVIERWLASTSLEQRHDLFVEAVHRALEPIGGTVPEGWLVEHADELWQQLGVPED